jgi:L-serine dehydratase
VASSIGGGSIETVSVDGYAVRFSGSLETLVIWHEDRPGFLAHVTSVLACIDSNIASIRTARFRRGAEALTVIEMDASPQSEVPSLLRKIDHVKKLRILPPLQ